jgi:hypothetical protein
MSAYAKEGGRLAGLITMAIPLCRAAQRQCPRAGPGAPPAYADWQMGVLIMVAVMARRKSKSAQYRYLRERGAWLQQRLGLTDFPVRSTYFQRYRRGWMLFERAVLLQGQRALGEGLSEPQTVAVDKSLIAARGPAWSVRDRRRGRWRRGVDRQADWGYSEHHEWVYGYSYEVVVSANARGMTFPLMVSVGSASRSEQRSFGPKIRRLPASTRYVLADAAYDSNAYGEAIEYTEAGRPTGRRLVCPLQPRAGKPKVGRYRHRGRRERLRQRRAKRLAFFQSPPGRRLYERRSKTVEPFNEWFKGKFDLNGRAWHRGLDNNATQIAAAMFVYQLLVRYHHAHGGTDGQIQWILDAL